MKPHPDIIAVLSGAVMHKLILSLLLLISSSGFLYSQQYDLVLEGGRDLPPKNSAN